MRELLGLYTPDALAGLAQQHEAPKASHNPVDILLSILARQPRDAEAESSVTSMRHLALSRLSAALYAAIPADRQVQLLLVTSPFLPGCPLIHFAGHILCVRILYLTCQTLLTFLGEMTCT